MFKHRLIFHTIHSGSATVPAQETPAEVSWKRFILKALMVPAWCAKHSQEQAFIVSHQENKKLLSPASSNIIYASCTTASNGHEQPIFMAKFWVRAVAQRHSIIQLCNVWRKPRGRADLRKCEFDCTLKRLERHSLQGSQLNCMLDCHPTSTVKVYKKAGTLLSERALHLYYSSRNKWGRRSDLDTEESRVERERRVTEGWMLHSSSALVGKPGSGDF